MKTFGWIFKKASDSSPSHFRTWLEEGHGCFWINGKAGSGKSTLLKFIHQQAALLDLLKQWAGHKRLVVSSFFFWHAGSRLQRSYEGILRSLLYQILDTRPDLTPIIFPRLTRFLLLRKSAEEFQISETELQHALVLLTTSMPPDMALFIVIDGVDEYTGDHFDFCRFITHLSSNPSTKILVSSRPIPACHQVFNRLPGLRLQDLTIKDIETYIHSELVQDELFQDRNRLQPGFADDVTNALVTKASGVFLWIVLVVKALLIRLGEYDDRDCLMATIDELPSDLEALYEHMFNGMTRERKQEGSLLLQVVTHAHENQDSPLTASQLFTIVQHFQGIDTLNMPANQSLEKQGLQVKSIEGKLRSRCCGLVEVQYSSKAHQFDEPKVDFLHRTVLNFVQDSSLQCKLKDLCNYDTAQMHVAMLAAFTHSVKQHATFCTAEYLDVLLAQFGECLAYSYRISLLDDSKYAVYLAVAESEFMACCTAAVNEIDNMFVQEEHARIYFQQRIAKLQGVINQPYQMARIPLVSRLGVPAVDDDLCRSSGLSASSLFTISTLGLPFYFREKLSLRPPDPAMKSQLLLVLLDVVSRLKKGSMLTKSYHLNIVALLKHGANPNLPVRLERLSGERRRKFGALVQMDPPYFTLSQEPVPTITPWDFWLVTQPEEVPLFSEVTLELINAGAELQTEFEPRAAAVANLHARLELCRENRREALQESVIDAILYKLKN